MEDSKYSLKRMGSGAERYSFEGKRLGVELVKAGLLEFEDAKDLMDDPFDYLRCAGVRIEPIEADSIDGMIREAEGTMINYALDEEDSFHEVIDELDDAVKKYGYTGTINLRKDGLMIEYCAGYDPIGFEVWENE